MNPADRPATEPRTYIMGIDPDEDAYLVRQEQERIEAEAAQGAAPRAGCVTPAIPHECRRCETQWFGAAPLDGNAIIEFIERQPRFDQSMGYNSDGDEWSAGMEASPDGLWVQILPLLTHVREAIASWGAAPRAEAFPRICWSCEGEHDEMKHSLAAPRAEGITYEQGEAWLEANDLYPPDKPGAAPRRHKRLYREEGDDAPTLDEEPQ